MDYGLSDREVKVLELTVSGKSDVEIAEACDVGVDTVRFDWLRIYAKTAAGTRGSALSTWYANDTYRTNSKELNLN